MHYHDSDDLKRLREFQQLAPAEFSAFVDFDKTVGRDGGAIPRKHRELTAIAVACAQLSVPIVWRCTLAQLGVRAPLARRLRKWLCWPPPCEQGPLLPMAH
jgi:alkylhydroperoxidase/carboxymuconolactone decarboxylase family protein YurZ